MNELYSMLDDYRINISSEVDLEILDKKQNDLGIVFPNAMRNFYQHYGNDKDVMRAFYIFDNIDDIRIENEALTFGEKHQGMGRLGITLKHLSSNFKSISWYDYSSKQWYSEGFVFPESFFFNIACWQLINTMDSVAKIHITENELSKILGDKLKLFTNKKIYIKGSNIISICGKEILGCYIKEDEELYLGTHNGDEVLQDLEECLNIDLDWL